MKPMKSNLYKLLALSETKLLPSYMSSYYIYIYIYIMKLMECNLYKLLALSETKSLPSY